MRAVFYMSYNDISNYYDRLFPFSDLKVSFLKKHLPADCSCIDLGCGTGAYTSALSSSGYRCIGLDLDQDMIEKARELHPNCQFVAAPMQSFDKVVRSIEAAFCIGNTLAYLTPELLKGFLSKLANALPSGGKWIFQVINWNYVLACSRYDFPDVYLSDMPTRPPLMFRRWYDNISSDKLEFHRLLLDGEQSITHAIDTLYPLTHNTLKEIHEKAGFRLLESYAGFDDTGFVTQKDSGLVMVFEK